MNHSTRIVVLGPQGARPNLRQAVASLDLPDGPIATITAGWQERESEDQELDGHLESRSLNLRLYERNDHVFGVDVDFAKAYRASQRTLHELEQIYDLRLSYAMDAVLRLLERDGDERLVEPEVEDAIHDLRELDIRHLERVDELRGEFEKEWKPLTREAVVREREELARVLAEAPAVAIAGGHVLVLLNRMRLFGLQGLLADKTIIAWSAGAMVLTERVVLFHDHPPQGPGNAEVLERGFGLCPGLVALPHGRKRLMLDDRERVARFARRFLPAASIIMDEGDRLDWDGSSWSAPEEAIRLEPDGTTVGVSSW